MFLTKDKLIIVLIASYEKIKAYGWSSNGGAGALLLYNQLYKLPEPMGVLEPPKHPPLATPLVLGL